MTPPAPKDPKKDKAEEAAAEEKPKRTRAKKADADAPAEKAAAKPRASRAKKADEGEEKPKRAPAKKKDAEPKAEEPKADEPTADEPTTDEPTTDEPTAEKAAAAEEIGEAGAERSEGASKPAPKKPAAKKKDEPKAEEKKSSRRRNGHVPEGVTVHAQAKYVRTSARKARLVCDHIRGKDVAEARAILAFTTRGAAKPWIKLLESAVANAEHNHELVGEELRIYSVHADEGPTLKRYRPRAMGRATRIRKRTSHLSITLTPKES
jgi:ribosomal protein L22